LIYVGVFIPLFLFIYKAIILSEENFLRNKFGQTFEEYCSRVIRWGINFTGVAKTFSKMSFNARRWVLKEYNTQFVWLVGITLLLLLNYPQLTDRDVQERNLWLGSVLLVLTTAYFYIRYMKKSGKWVSG